MVPFPKEVFGWYKSTSLDTAKMKIPFAVKMMLVAALSVPVLAYYGWKTFNQRLPGSGVAKSGPVVPLADGVGSRVVSGRVEAAKVQTPLEYVAQFQARLEGLPHTAPRYDDLTKPVSVPFPAACISMGERCTCYTQQATVMDVKKPLCLQIVKNGYFNDWQQVQTAVASVSGASAPGGVPGAVLPPVPGHVGGENVAAAGVLGDKPPAPHIPVTKPAPLVAVKPVKAV
jgi:zona occludens toxin